MKTAEEYSRQTPINKEGVHKDRRIRKEMMMAKARAHVFVEGRVQGVFFRAETQRSAELYNLKGWVRNLPDGRVESVFEGEAADVEKMIAWCRKGPPHAVVQNLGINREDFKGRFDKFSVLL